ncbi:MAG: ABC transporter permease [Chloroflexaceae bacterium]|jgi:putative spermidine/putrescine transport system permease protein|nr:ABC transporter permease [Chloroflexaceae bacterium]
MHLNPWRILRLGWLGLVLLFLFTPVVVTVLGSFSESWQQRPWEAFTLRWYAYVFETYGPAFRVSLLVALATMLATTLIGVPAAYALVRYQFRGKSLVEDVLLLPLTLPGLALGLAIVQTYALLRGQWLLLLLGHIVFTLPYMVQIVAASLRTSGIIGLEAAAASLGANWWQRFTLVIAPGMRNATLSAALAVATLSLGEFNLSYFLYTPLAMPLPVGMYEAYASLRIEIGSAFTSLFLALILPVLLLGQALGRTKVSSGT